MTERTKQAFMDAAKGLRAHEVVRAIRAHRLSPGVNFAGCSKGRIAECWVSGLYATFSEVPLDRLIVAFHDARVQKAGR